MKDYVAWLNGASVARGTLRYVKDRAIEVWRMDSWREFGDEDGKTILKITRGPKQYFVESIILQRGDLS